MKKIIPFLASNYRNDKIWMRRSVPNKRDYKVTIRKYAFYIIKFVRFS